MSEQWTKDQVTEFVDAHAAAAVWTLTGLVDRADMLAPAARERLDREAREFAAAQAVDLVTWLAPSHAGYDLWLTRNGEGVGFWARYLPNDPPEVFSAEALRDRRSPDRVTDFNAAMNRLSGAARQLGEVSLYSARVRVDGKRRRLLLAA